MGVIISKFNNVSDTKPKDFVLEDWLKQTKKPPKHLKNLVNKYRLSKDKKDKLNIPCITVSASFKDKRNLDNIKKETGLICIDIDNKDNPFLLIDNIKDYFKKHPSVLYVGNSVSNNGLYIIIKINKKKPLIKYFKFFKKQFLKSGVIIDESCKDYTRLRFFSVDKTAYLNTKAIEFNLPKKLKTNKGISKIASKTDTEKVEAVIGLIENHAIDITVEYSDWVKIAAALNGAFGEGGRDYFHRISRFNHGYKKKDTDRKYTNCRNMNKIALSSLFYVADSYGIRY